MDALNRFYPLPLASIVVALVVAASPATTKRPFEIADYFGTAFVGPPAVSADGRSLAFVVRRYHLEEGESSSEVWLMNADGTNLRRMTHGGWGDRSPAISPDGRQLLFVSDRGGRDGQLWTMPVEGGEAMRLTDFPLVLAEPVWSPDGRWIAVTSRVYPECGADPACNGSTNRAWTGGRLKAHLADTLLFRHWDEWRDGRWSHVLLVDAATGVIARDLTPGRFDTPSYSPGGGRGYAFAPDGKELCFASDHSAVPALSTNSDLFTVSIDGPSGSPARCLTSENEAWDGDPAYSADGRWIAFRRQAVPGHEADLYRLMLFDRRTGTIDSLTDRRTFDNWVLAHAWARDGRSLVFQAAVGGRTPLFRIGATTRAVRPVVTDGTITGFGIVSREAVVYTRSRASEPPEVQQVSSDGAPPEQLTSFNRQLRETVDLRPAEEVMVPGDGGRPVHVFVVKPHGFDPSVRYPLILNVHGGPQGQWSDSYRGDWQIYPGKGYVVALPNPTGSTGFGQDFVDAVSCDWGGRVYRDLMRVTDALEQLPWVDRARMGAMGWSFGGYMTMWFQGHTTRFRALASMMGEYDLRSMYGTTDETWFVEHELCGPPWTSDHYERWSASPQVGGFHTPSLVITGERDFRVPYEQSLHYFTGLQRMGVPSRLVVLSEASHAPGWYDMAFYYLLHVEWFHRWLGGGAPPWDVEQFQRNRVFGPAASVE